MNWIFLLVGAVLVLQIVIFIWGRRIRKRERESNVLVKYGIDSRQKAWQCMANPDIPKEDRTKIRRFYEDENEII